MSDLRTKLLQRLTGENSFVRGLNEKNADILLNYSIAKLIICIYSVDGGIYSFLGIILLGLWYIKGSVFAMHSFFG